jgi:protein SCO1/2
VQFLPIKKVLLFLIIVASVQVFAEVALLNRQGENINPANYEFTDESGKVVKLSEFFSPKKPVILAPVYYECSGVCTITLNQLFYDLKRLGFNPGKALQVVVFSINPKETPKLALAKKNTYVTKYGYQEFENGFHFLTGQQHTIERLTAVLGFKYEKAEEQYIHPGAFYILTPEGVISKVMSGKSLNIKKLQDIIFNAANGRKMTTFEKMVLSCKPDDKTK